jgi:hypothetical protein
VCERARRLVDGVDGRLDRPPEGVERRAGELVEPVLGLVQRALSRRRDRDRVRALGDQWCLGAEAGWDRQSRELAEGRGPGRGLLGLVVHRLLGRLRELHRTAARARRAADHERRPPLGGAGLGDRDHRLDGLALGQAVEQRPRSRGARGVARGGEHERLLAFAIAERLGERDQEARRGRAARRPVAARRVARCEDDHGAPRATGQREQDVAKRDVLALELALEVLLGDGARGDVGEPLGDEIGDRLVAGTARLPVGGQLDHLTGGDRGPPLLEPR